MRFGDDINRYNQLKEKAENIQQTYGSDRGMKAVRNYQNHLISLPDLDDLLARIEREASNPSANRKNRSGRRANIGGQIAHA